MEIYFSVDFDVSHCSCMSQLYVEISSTHLVLYWKLKQPFLISIVNESKQNHITTIYSNTFACIYCVTLMMIRITSSVLHIDGTMRHLSLPVLAIKKSTFFVKLNFFERERERVTLHIIVEIPLKHSRCCRGRGLTIFKSV